VLFVVRLLQFVGDNAVRAPQPNNQPAGPAACKHENAKPPHATTRMQPAACKSPHAHPPDVAAAASCPFARLISRGTCSAGDGSSSSSRIASARRPTACACTGEDG